MKFPASVCFLAALLLSMHVCPAIAQAVRPGEPPKEIEGKSFREYANSQEYFDLLAREAMTYESRLGPCATPKKVVRLQAGRPQIPSSFPKFGIPPQWMEVLKITGCDKPVLRSVLVLYINRKLVILPLINGKSLSRFDVLLQRDVIQTLIATERTLAHRAGCPRDGAVRILDTRTVSKITMKGGLDWEEEWKLANCNGEKRVKVSYKYRDGTGTDFTIKQVKDE